LLATLLAAWPAQAEVPNFVTYSGRLTDGTAWGQTSTADLTFWLCEQPDGDIADCVWTETLDLKQAHNNRPEGRLSSHARRTHVSLAGRTGSELVDWFTFRCRLLQVYAG